MVFRSRLKKGKLKSGGLRSSGGRLKKRQSKEKIRAKTNAIIDRVQSHLLHKHEMEEIRAAALAAEEVQAPDPSPYEKLCQFLGVDRNKPVKSKKRSAVHKQQEVEEAEGEDDEDDDLEGDEEGEAVEEALDEDIVEEEAEEENGDEDEAANWKNEATHLTTPSNAETKVDPKDASYWDALLEFLQGDPYFAKYHPGDRALHRRNHYEWVRTSQRYAPMEFPTLGSVVTSTVPLMEIHKMATSPVEFQKRQRLHESVARQWLKLKKSEDLWHSMTPLQRAIFSTTSHYYDLLHCCRTWENEEEIMEALMLHILNHIKKSKNIRDWHRTRMGRRIHELKKRGGDGEPEVRDQGFTNCSVLLLLPFRNIAFRYVEKLLQILGDTDVVGAESFAERFGAPEEGRQFMKRPLDYRRQFYGNIDDEFCYGVTLKPNHIELGSGFYRADLIVASPMSLLNEAQKGENGKNNFLSSIELVVVDQADAILMQNWEWLEKLLDLCCRPPKVVKYTQDYRRVHQWHLQKCAHFFLHTVIVSRYQDPRFVAFFDRKLFNISGRVQVQQEFKVGAIGNIFNGTRSIMQRLSVDSPADASDVHFKFFTEMLLPQLASRLTTIFGQKGLIVFVPSYFDYVRLRNFLDESDRECFREMCEYTSGRDLVVATEDFASGECNLVLMTERFYFFKRWRLKKARNVIFYRPPLNAHFYHDIINDLDSATDNPLCYLFFNRYDIHALARIVGTERAKKMVLAEKDTHMFS